MAIAHPASSEAGPQPESNKKAKNQPEAHVDRGTELDAAPPVAAPTVVPDAISHGKRKKPVDSTGEAASGDSALVIAGGDEAAEGSGVSQASESSASHLAGGSDGDVQSVDAK